jgi:hypothetical protein
MSLEQIKEKLARAEKSMSSPLLTPSLKETLAKQIEQYKKDIAAQEGQAEKKVEKAETKDLQQIKEKLARAEKSMSSPLLTPSLKETLAKQIEQYKKDIAAQEGQAEKKVEQAEKKVAEAKKEEKQAETPSEKKQTKKEVKEAKAGLTKAVKEKQEVKQAVSKVARIAERLKKRSKPTSPTKIKKPMKKAAAPVKKVKASRVKVGRKKATSQTKMLKPIKKAVAPVEKVKTKSVRAFGQTVEYSNDTDFCRQLIKAFKRRKIASKKAGARRKTKPVFGVITASVKSAVSKALYSVPEKQITRNPQAFLAKAQSLEKSAIRFLEDFKAILGADYKKTEITTEFGELERTIKNFVAKFTKAKA